MKHTFHLIDLGSQASAVADFATGWSRAQLLEWLGRSGRLTALPQWAGAFHWEGPLRLWSTVSFPDDEHASIQELTGGGFKSSIGAFVVHSREVVFPLGQ